MVARKYENVFGVVYLQEPDILIDGIGSALIPGRVRLGLVRRKNMHAPERPVQIPRQAVSHVLVKDQRLILRQHADGIYTRINTV